MGPLVLIWVGVVLGGIGVCVVELEQWIAEIFVRVGFSDEYSIGEESDQDGAEEFWNTGSGGIYGCHAENACAVSTEMPEMPVKVALSLSSSVLTSLCTSNLNLSRPISLQVSSSSEISPSLSRSISPEVFSLS
jgi:hypothetical protein